MKSHQSVQVDSYPICDICAQHGETEVAHYDAKTFTGQWANLCEGHFVAFGCKLGLGKGQRLVLKTQ